MGSYGDSDGSSVYSLFIGVFLIVLGLWSVYAFFGYNVDAGYTGVKFDSFAGGVQPGNLPSGFGLKLPWQYVVSMSTQTQKDTIKTQGASSDLQVVNMEIVVNYRLVASEAPRVYKEIGESYADKLITPAIQDGVKAATAKYKAEDLIKNRELVRTDIDERLKARFKGDNFLVFEGENIVDFDFTDDYNKAIEQKAAQEQNRQQALILLEITRINATQNAVQAEGVANATLINAKAQAEALKIQRAVITPELLALRAIEKWNGVMPLATGGAMPLLNANPSELVSRNLPVCTGNCTTVAG